MFRGSSRSVKVIQGHSRSCVEDWIDGRVCVAEPEQERVEPVRQTGQESTVPADAPCHVQREESQPHGAEDANDGCHTNSCSHLTTLAARQDGQAELTRVIAG